MGVKGVVVRGLTRHLAALDKAKGKELNRQLKMAYKEAAMPVVEEAKRHVPVDSGNLQKSIKSAPTRSGARVKAGTPARTPYAEAVHFGWPSRGIKPQPFIYDALDERIGEVLGAFEAAMKRLEEEVNKTTK